MFNFMKKGSASGADKTSPASTAGAGGMIRDEARRSKLRRRKDKLPSGITADYSANFLAAMPPLPPLPPLPPRPPARGILKTKTADVGNEATYQNTPLPPTPGGESPDSDEYLSAPLRGSTSPDSSFGSASPGEARSPLPLPPVAPPGGQPRQLRIDRTPRGDFGFSLRRAMLSQRSPARTVPVILAEPAAANGTGLLPGDRLLEVNGVAVDDKTREEVIDLIKSSGASVSVKVQPVPELSELTRRSGLDGVCAELDDAGIRGGTLRRSGSRRFRENHAARSAATVAREAAWRDGTERLWLVHAGGFTAARRGEMSVPGSAPGQVAVRLEHSGEMLCVDEDDLEKANPEALDRVEALGLLRHVNEASALHTLRQRFAVNLVHTYAGPALAAINPGAPLAIYSDKVASLFRGCSSEDMPPHIFSAAQASLRSMLASRRDHSLVALGRAGSGKSATLRHAARYLRAPGSPVSAERLAAATAVLDAVGSSRDGSRHSQILALGLDQAGLLCSASVQVMLLERSQVSGRVRGDGTFVALELLAHGAGAQLRRSLYLDPAPSHVNRYVGPCAGDEEAALGEFQRLAAHLTALGVSDQEALALWSVLAAVLHLGWAGAVRGGGGRWQFAAPGNAAHAAALLGTPEEELARVLFPAQTPPAQPVGPDALDALAGALYAELFHAAAALVNRGLSEGSSSNHAPCSLLLVDVPGMRVTPSKAPPAPGAPYPELARNYLAERILHLFRDHALVAPRDKYLQERVECPDAEGVGESPELLPLLDGGTGGLLQLLESATTDEDFIEGLFQRHGGPENGGLLRKSPGRLEFELTHLAGTCSVRYSAIGWLQAAREHPAARAAGQMLLQSSREMVAQVFASSRGAGASGAALDGAHSLRRSASMRRAFCVGAQRRSLAAQLKATADGLVETLRRTRMQFVHCFLAQAPIAVTTNAIGNGNGMHANMTNGTGSEDFLDVPLLREQLRGSWLLAAARLHKQGWPDPLPLPEFRRRFRLLAPESAGGGGDVDERQAVADMLRVMEVDMGSVRIGLSQVFFRSGVLAQLEAARDERLTAHVQRLQARCRGMLARRRLAKLRLHDVAIRCVQRNVRLLLAVRSWPWWKLLMRITPLLGVRSAEQQLQLASEELTAVRTKAEKLEAERAMLQQESDRMAAQLSEMSADLADERAAAQLAAQRLDAETAHRTRLERDLADTQARESKLSAASARLEAELLAVRADDANVDADADDDEAGAETLRARLARAGRELALLRHRLTQQHADDLEQLVALKKQMEKKLADVYEDVNAQRQTAAQAQRKAQKLSSESNDLRLHLEEQAARNALLEKKQRRFDSELQAALESGRTEKRERERATRERDLALAEKTALEQSLSATQLEVQLREDQAAALTRELDAAAAGGHSELELASLRRTRHELESKLQEQEDELDDLAGQLAMLGQAKLRLEMSLEQQRKEARREQAQRDEELDEARGNASKKVKALEAALEGEHEERTRLLREKHELERRANDALANASRSREEQEHALRTRKELKRTRALLKDAQQALAAQQDAPNKALLRQLRHQLEDAEAARAAAARGRQSAETELAELRAQLDEAARAKQDAESRANAAIREKQELRAQLDENEEELSEVLKKYGLTVSALSAAQAASAEAAANASALEAELRAQRDAAAELQARLDAAGADPECSLAQRRLELRVREAESRLELEQTTRGRLEVQISRLKEAVGRATSEAVTARGREAEAEGAARRASRQLREAREAASAAAARDSEAAARRKDAEQRLEAAAAETAALRQELRAALARVADLQLAMQDECSLSDSGPESDSDESIESFLVGHDGSERDGSERDGSEAPSLSSTEQRLGLEDSIQESFA